ncbi:MAG TPA: TRASH domain-containing protein [Candidatus Sulfotelmatobacter sp.]|nr:TRASH domain-containing protein [Candidatus Sulfotelmatobacter sp.]
MLRRFTVLEEVLWEKRKNDEGFCFPGRSNPRQTVKKQQMKAFKILTGAVVCSGILALSSLALAAEHEAHGDAKNPKLKPYTLKTCLVSGEKLGGSMGDPYVHKYQDREIKFCCKGCLKDFNKEPAKYLKKLDEAEKGGKDAQAGAAAHNPGHHQH